MLLSLTEVSKSNLQNNEMDISYTSSPSPFLSEKALVREFSNLAKFRVDSSIGHTMELNAGNGIADIGIYKLRADWKNYANIALLRPQWAYPLVSLPYRKTFNENILKTLACVSNKSAKIILKQYCAAGFCHKNSSGWIKVHQPRNPINQIYAIEAKLRDWKKALYQATRYHEFAHQSWVLLDHYYSGIALKNKNEFIKRNVGLASIERDGKLSIHINSVTSAPRSPYRYWFATSLILREILSQKSTVEPV
ncbi:MAG: hypothetical protein LC541_20345 [Candidatus Thiodiazotropha sp.]|nr:hypothetical protein [Candidatus Thiodiazotropha sp.]MCM8922153.1 hypothetical protein [Candidatus Thiodiazotropha sp.]